jgi:trans-4-hydroxy-L-proline dehydratase
MKTGCCGGSRRLASRMAAMPVEVSPNELIVGRPEMRPPTAEEQAEIEDLQVVLASIPPFPGGDAGHFHPDWDKVFRKGVTGIRTEIAERRQTASTEQVAFYDACDLAMQSVTRYALRVSEVCAQAAAAGTPGDWSTLGAVCRKVAVMPPATFHEAIQLMYLMTIALWFGEDHGLTTPGRMDQTLRRFYEADLAAGLITRDGARDLISCLFIQLNEILGPGSAISVIVGGRDTAGQDVTNDLTYLTLEARLATQLVYPTVGIAWHEGTPPELMDFSTRMLSTGIGDPAFFNDELIVAGLRDHGVSEPDSYNWMNSTCVEVKVCGASHMWVTAPYFNCPKALLEVMDGVADGSVPDPGSFEALSRAVQNHLAATVRGAAENLDWVWQQRAVTGCFPLASCVISDCLERGLDFDRGGARYHWVEDSFVGLANLVDGLLAVKELVYDSADLTLLQLRDVLKADFGGHEALRQRILNAIPKYGNDDPEADALAVKWADFLSDTTEANTVGGHRYVPGFFCWIMHEIFGSDTGATPDGRQAGFPLADGAGPAQGREKAGPTAAIMSSTKWSHRRAMGGLVHNAKFSRLALRCDADFAALGHLAETYLRRGGFELQVNVVGADVLRDAQAHPERYPDLLVRVAGYSDYFVHLNANMQAEVIARNEHEAL